MIPEIKDNVILKPYTTFKCGGPASKFAEPSSADEVIALLEYASNNNLEVLVIGAGSNMLVCDGGFDGLVIRLGKAMSGITFEDEGDSMLIRAQAGCSLALFGNKCAAEGLEGMEFCCGIPGTVGGAVFMNAGAYGREIKDIAVEVEYIENGEIKTIAAAECEFGYRESIFERRAAQGEKIIVTALKARLNKGDKDSVAAYIAELKAKRCASQPVDVPSAGSTFKRPAGYYAGALIQDSGLKGFKLDESGAQVSPKHAGFVVNNGGTASASDVLRLIRFVQDKVKADSGVTLETEVRIIGGDK